MTENIRNIGDYITFLDREARRQEYEVAVVKVLKEHGGILAHDDLTQEVAAQLFHGRSSMTAQEEGELYTAALTELHERNTITVNAQRKVVLSPSIMRADQL